MNSIYIGIDLAWGEKNLSGFCALVPLKNSLKIEEIKLLKSIDEIVLEIEKYQDNRVFVGVDAPLEIFNEEGNRECEKSFNKDFAKYKISMLPVNRKLLTKFSPNIRSEELYKKLKNLGFKRDYNSDKVIFEVYPHSSIAMLFNAQKILPYKRKKGRDVEFIREQLSIYTKYLSKVISPHKFLKTDAALLKGKTLKDFEDMLDAITCAYTMKYCRDGDAKFYKNEAKDIFVTPISPWRVYILKCSDNTLYTGVTTDLNRRLKEHNNSNLGAKYTRAKRPVELVYFECCDDKVHAMQREYAIKQLTRNKKLELISSVNKD